MSLCGFQIETPEIATCRVEQDNIRLWTVHLLRIECNQVVPDLYCFQGLSGRTACTAA